MIRPRTLLVVAVLIWLAATGAAQTPNGGTAAPSPAGASDMSGRYIGSESCRDCHEGAYAAWQRSLHSQMTKPIEQASVRGRFVAEAPVVQHGRSYTTSHADGRYAITVTQPGATPETFDIDYTLGAKRLQGYLSRLPDGRLYVLPLFWNVEWKRWLDWREITPVPDADHDVRQIWNVNCFNCHATNIRRNFDVATRTFATTTTEFGIGCEACHGPGRDHVELTGGWRRDPSSRKAGGDLRIFSSRFATSQQVYDTCAYCHGNKTNYFTGFTPGDRLEDFAQLALISDPVPQSDPQGDFWPDGRPSRFNRPQALTLAGCFRASEISCTSCHLAHGSPNEFALKVPLANSDRLCTQCHQKLTEPLAVSRHSHHAAESPGSRCVECHMSDVNWRLLSRRRDHTFASPVPELTARFGIPNACTTCHEDRSPEWAASEMDRWYGNSSRRRASVDVAETMYAAGSGQADSIERLAAIAADPAGRTLIRASAAGFIGRLASPEHPASPAVVRALVEASTDPEPMVRVAAVRALGTSGAESAIAALAARLTDAARVVRSSAAEALLYLGVSSGFGEPLTRAQDEYADSLREFPDMASNHASLGWLLASQGKTDEAVRSLQLARSLDPTDARPLVYLGVLAARGGRFGEAIDDWRAARRLNPSYPNIDRLIAEAETRR